jgi:hypothetical protein
LEPDPETPAQREAWLELWRRWELAAFKGLPGGDPQSHRKRLTLAHAACAARRPHDPAGLFEEAARVFCADCDKRGERYRLDWLCNQFAQWCEQPAAVVDQGELDEQIRRARVAADSTAYNLRLDPDDPKKQQYAADAKAALEQLRARKRRVA